MARLQIQPDKGITTFEPLGEICGRVTWVGEPSPEGAELRLFWYTRGKGTTDVNIVETILHEATAINRDEEFHFPLPEGPYSFSGKLISLIWALELICEPSGETARLEIAVAPGGREVGLYEHANVS